MGVRDIQNKKEVHWVRGVDGGWGRVMDRARALGREEEGKGRVNNFPMAPMSEDGHGLK